MKIPKEPTRSKIVKKLDKIVSDEVKRLARGVCARCHQSRPNMGCSHYFSRRYIGVRWDLQNLDWLCWMPCHVLWEKSKNIDYADFMENKLGKEKLEILKVKALAVTKFSTQDLEFLLAEFKKGNFV